ELDCLSHHTDDLGARTDNLDVDGGKSDRSAERIEVIRLGSRALANKKDTLARRSVRPAAPEIGIRPELSPTGHQPSPAVLSGFPADTALSNRSRTGTAPYRPARYPFWSASSFRGL